MSMMKLSKRIGTRRNERGQGLVELALTLPMLIMILGGAIHFGLMMRAQGVITNASRVGARRAGQPQGDEGRVQAAVLDYCHQAGLTSDVDVQVDINRTAARSTVTVSYEFTSPVAGMFGAAVRLATGQDMETTNQLQATTVMSL